MLVSIISILVVNNDRTRDQGTNRGDKTGEKKWPYNGSLGDVGVCIIMLD
jgi:hypothetical protein